MSKVGRFRRRVVFQIDVEDFFQMGRIVSRQDPKTLRITWMVFLVFSYRHLICAWKEVSEVNTCGNRELTEHCRLDEL